MKYEFNIEHNTIFTIINNSMCKLCFVTKHKHKRSKIKHKLNIIIK
jgi:hypothetical protein